MAIIALKFRMRKNVANGNQLISVNGGQTGKFSDAVNTDTFVATDLMDFSLDTTTTGTSGSVSCQFASVMIENTTASAIKTIGGLAKANVKTVGGLDISFVKTVGGLQ